MTKRIVARWQDWAGKGLEHLVLDLGEDGVIADATVLASDDDKSLFVADYVVRCDSQWRVREARISVRGEARALDLRCDGAGHWTDGAGTTLPHLDTAIDIDITVTPFTNTLPIRRLGWTTGQAAELRMAYVWLPELAVTAELQRYTCLEPGRRFRFEALSSGFRRDLDIDADGLVTTYPDLFRRVV